MKKDLLYEWEDERTGKVYRCPRCFRKVFKHLEVGNENAKHPGELLEAIGMEVTEDNLRHLRQMMMIFRRKGHLVFSVRSKKGGYYLAGREDRKEVRRYIRTQRSLATSMLNNALILEENFNDLYLSGM